MRRQVADVLDSLNAVPSVRFNVPIVEVLECFTTQFKTAVFVDEDDLCALALADCLTENKELRWQFCGEIKEKAKKFDRDSYFKRHLPGNALVYCFNKAGQMTDVLRKIGDLFEPFGLTAEMYKHLIPIPINWRLHVDEAELDSCVLRAVKPPQTSQEGETEAEAKSVRPKPSNAKELSQNESTNMGKKRDLNGRGYITCPHCQREVRSDNLKRHSGGNRCKK